MEDKIKHGAKLVEQALQHHGVKGMKWGVRRAAKKAGTVIKTRIKEDINSSKRERSWVKDLKSINNMSTGELKSKTNRLRMENDLKYLTKSQKVRSFSDAKQKSRDKKAYRNRDKMTDKQLKDKVEKLGLKLSLRREISRSTKDQRDAYNSLIDSYGKKKGLSADNIKLGKELVDSALGKF